MLVKYKKVYPFFNGMKGQLKDRPLFELNLRKYEKPSDLNERELSKRICLSLGLLQPGDSRDVVVDIFLALLNAYSEGKILSSRDVENFVFDYRNKNGLPLTGITPSNINRQLHRIRDVGLIEKVENGFRIREFLPLEQIFTEYFLPHVLDPLLERIKLYLKEADKHFSREKQKI
ncbi:MAG: hypothetical protein PWQ28_608 [Candidatus Woesearchaeota archaeon]|nr:hypothetical protein [Candidatus Woesearchaeota archaeon]